MMTNNNVTTTNVSKIVRDDFIIEQDNKTPHLYAITFSCPSIERQILIHSITKTKILVGATITTDYTKLIVRATSLYTLSQYKTNKNLEQTHHFLFLLSKQLEYLITKTNHCFIGYNPENMIIIDDNKCFYLSAEHLHRIDKNKITITYPFTKTDFFLSPELERIKEIPSTTHYKTSYYSLARLIIYMLTKNDATPAYILDNASSIQETKLYWLLKRCLHENPSYRTILFL